MPPWSPWELGSSAWLSYDYGIRSWQAVFCVVQGTQADKARRRGKRDRQEGSEDLFKTRG